MFSQKMMVLAFLGRGKLIKGNLTGDRTGGGGAVGLEKGVAIGAVRERHVEDLGVLQRLLHAGTDGVVVVLGLDDGEGEVRLVGEDVVGLFRLATLHGLAAHDHAPLGEVRLLPNLGHEVPLVPRRPNQGGRDELGP